MHTRNYDVFQSELYQLLGKSKVENFFFATVTFDGGDLTDLPVMANVVGNREQNLGPARLTAVMVEQCVKALIQLTMRYCGLQLHQAVGVMVESTKAAAFELQQQQEAYLQSQRGHAEG